jgi:hypothetical protein
MEEKPGTPGNFPGWLKRAGEKSIFPSWLDFASKFQNFMDFWRKILPDQFTHGMFDVKIPAASPH